MTPSERDRERAQAWLGQQPHVGRHDWADRAWCTACVDSLAAFRAAARIEALEEVTAGLCRDIAATPEPDCEDWRHGMRHAVAAIRTLAEKEEL